VRIIKSPESRLEGKGKMKETDLAYCGLNCQRCPVLAATARNDYGLREKTAKEWSDLYAKILETMGLNRLKPEDINCHGCRTESGRFLGCERCSIRSCCQGKNLVTCASCTEYESCEMLKGFYSFEVHHPAKDNLDKIRSGE
jgi:hypothetical protein